MIAWEKVFKLFFRILCIIINWIYIGLGDKYTEIAISKDMKRIRRIAETFSLCLFELRT